MAILLKANLILVILLCLSAGAVKMMRMPHEVKFFEDVGLSVTLLVLLGVMQVAAGILLLFYKSRRAGAMLAAVSFLVSTITIFSTGNFAFGVFSLLPVLMAIVISANNIELHSAWR